jgi:hypothetical protein
MHVRVPLVNEITDETIDELTIRTVAFCAPMTIINLDDDPNTQGNKFVEKIGVIYKSDA